MHIYVFIYFCVVLPDFHRFVLIEGIPHPVQLLFNSSNNSDDNTDVKFYDAVFMTTAVVTVHPV